MKIRTIIPVVAAVLTLSMSCLAYCDNGASYDDTVALITKNMASSTSVARVESYGYIKIDKCMLNYNVFGTFPVGTLYDMKFSNIDFSSLDRQGSRVGQDYTDFIILNFKNPARYKIGREDLAIHSVVVNVFDDEDAQILFKAFLHLGELCGASTPSPS